MSASTNRRSTSSRLRAAVAGASPIVRKYIAAIERDILGHQENIAELEAKLLGAFNRIKVLEKERKPIPPSTEHDELDVAKRIAFILARSGMTIVDASGKKISSLKAPKPRRRGV